MKPPSQQVSVNVIDFRESGQSTLSSGPLPGRALSLLPMVRKVGIEQTDSHEHPTEANEAAISKRYLQFMYHCMCGESIREEQVCYMGSV